MKSLKIIFLLSFILIGFSWENSLQAQKPTEESLEKTQPTVDFNAEEIEKIRTLIEQQLKTRVSKAEFSLFGKPTKENLALFKKIDEFQKDDPFFSQPHITYIIESMEERLGTKRPKPKSNLDEPSKKRKVHKISKLPKNKSDNS